MMENNLAREDEEETKLVSLKRLILLIISERCQIITDLTTLSSFFSLFTKKDNIFSRQNVCFFREKRIQAFGTPFSMDSDQIDEDENC